MPKNDHRCFFFSYIRYIKSNTKSYAYPFRLLCYLVKLNNHYSVNHNPITLFISFIALTSLGNCLVLYLFIHYHLVLNLVITHLVHCLLPVYRSGPGTLYKLNRSWVNKWKKKSTRIRELSLTLKSGFLVSQPTLVSPQYIVWKKT